LGAQINEQRAHFGRILRSTVLESETIIGDLKSLTGSEEAEN
jgi:hypothetical protein